MRLQKPGKRGGNYPSQSDHCSRTQPKCSGEAENQTKLNKSIRCVLAAEKQIIKLHRMNSQTEQFNLLKTKTWFIFPLTQPSLKFGLPHFDHTRQSKQQSQPLSLSISPT